MTLVASAAFAKRGGGLAAFERESLPSVSVDPQDRTMTLSPASAALTTTSLYFQTFDSGATCTEAGWTKVDATAQIAVFWHVEDFITGGSANVNPGDSLAVISGTKSLWCGARASTTGLTCGYFTLPGYGNDWNQSWRTKTCIVVSGGALDVNFKMELDSEPAYDATFLEYTTDCTSPFTGWTVLDGGIGVWDGIANAATYAASYPLAVSPVKVRLRFFADGGYSDEDGSYDSHAGPVVIDDLTVEAVPTETFESSAVGATSTTNWEGFGEPGYGQHMALFSGLSLVQQDACAKNLSCQWAAISGSSETYACGGFPLQAAVPKGNADGQYLNNEVWSPSFALAGSGAVINLQFTVYRDMTLDGLVFYTWDVRSINGVGCESAWRSRGFVYFGPQKDYLLNTFPVGDLIPASAVSMRVRFGVVDMCGVWCGVFGTGACHAHAPLLDRVRVYRVDIFGPTYSTRDIDMFQDTFPHGGTDTGIGKASMARSITASASPTILPGDSIIFTCVDPVTAVIPSNRSGLADDVALGGKQLYIWVHVISRDFVCTAATIAGGGGGYTLGDVLTVSGGVFSVASTLTVTAVGGGGAITGVSVSNPGVYKGAPSNPVSVTGGTGAGATFNKTWGKVYTNAPASKSGAAVADGSSGTSGFPFKDTQVADGKTWTRIRCRLNNATTSQFAVDLNDNLFEAGDVVEFFFGATSTAALTSYCSGSNLGFVQSDVTVAAQNASEFTILPLNADGTDKNDILYVDGMDGRGAQGFFDVAFSQLALNPDRYDVRGPTSSVSNRPGTRVFDVSQQLNANYQKIIWDAGDITQNLGDGTGAPEKSNDYAMVNSFLGGLSSAGGVYICGDDYLAGLNAAAGASAVSFKSTYMTFTLSSGNHRAFLAGAPIAPQGTGVAGGLPTQAFSGDTWVIFGGCPLINDFDVATPTGSTIAQSHYTATAAANNAAEISKVTGNAKVMVSGYSFIYIRDDEEDGTRDGTKHMYDIITWLGNTVDQPTDAKPVAVNRLEQNYPNPFNPQTTIAFTMKDRGRVKIDVYNVKGELVKTLVDETRAAGSYTDVKWNGTNNADQPVSSGVYFYRLVTNNFSQTKKMVLLK